MPLALVVLLGAVGAFAILACEFYSSARISRDPGLCWKWVAQPSVWLFNAAVVIGSVAFLSTTA